jgi:hypothetical protein
MQRKQSTYVIYIPLRELLIYLQWKKKETKKITQKFSGKM